jgi:hypothetical protein
MAVRHPAPATDQFAFDAKIVGAARGALVGSAGVRHHHADTTPPTPFSLLTSPDDFLAGRLWISALNRVFICAIDNEP